MWNYFTIIVGQLLPDFQVCLGIQLVHAAKVLLCNSQFCRDKTNGISLDYSINTFCTDNPVGIELIRGFHSSLFDRLLWISRTLSAVYFREQNDFRRFKHCLYYLRFLKRQQIKSVGIFIIIVQMIALGDLKNKIKTLHII